MMDRTARSPCSIDGLRTARIAPSTVLRIWVATRDRAGVRWVGCARVAQAQAQTETERKLEQALRTIEDLSRRVRELESRVAPAPAAPASAAAPAPAPEMAPVPASDRGHDNMATTKPPGRPAWLCRRGLARHQRRPEGIHRRILVVLPCAATVRLGEVADRVHLRARQQRRPDDRRRAPADRLHVRERRHRLARALSYAAGLLEHRVPPRPAAAALGPAAAVHRLRGSRRHPAGAHGGAVGHGRRQRRRGPRQL